MRSSYLMRSCRLLFVAILLAKAAAVFAAEPAAPAVEAAGAEHAAAAHHGELTHGNAGAQSEDMLEFKSDLAIYTFVVFILLLAILGKFAWPTIIKALEQRERTINDHIAAAEARHEDAKRLFAEHEAKLAAAAGEVRALLEEARRDAEHTKKSHRRGGQKGGQGRVGPRPPRDPSRPRCCGARPRRFERQYGHRSGSEDHSRKAHARDEQSDRA